MFRDHTDWRDRYQIEGGKLTHRQIEGLASDNGLSWLPRPDAGSGEELREGLVLGASRDVMSFLHALGRAEGGDALVEAERLKD